MGLIPDVWHHIVWRSQNRYLRGCTVMSTTTNTCPRTCGFLGKGCHAERGNAGIHRRAHDKGKYKRWTFYEMLDLLTGFTKVCRAHVSGDVWALDKGGEAMAKGRMLPFVKKINELRLWMIIYHHKAVVPSRGVPIEFVEWNLESHREVAEVSRVAINASLECLSYVDRVVDLGLDCVVVLKKDEVKRTQRTPGGNKVVLCPAKDKTNPRKDSLDCTNCGGYGKKPLCARKNRGFVIGFPATGGVAKQLTIVGDDYVEA